MFPYKKHNLRQTRFIHPQTQLPYQVGENSHKIRCSMNLISWHKQYAIHVDLQGRRLLLTGAELDMAIAEGNKMSDAEKKLGELKPPLRQVAITDSQWRLLHLSDRCEYSQNKERYIDALTGLPPVDRNGELIVITPSLAKSKVTTGEWVTIKQFTRTNGDFFYTDKKGERTKLTGSQLQQAINDQKVYLSSNKFTSKYPLQKIPTSQSAPGELANIDQSTVAINDLNSTAAIQNSLSCNLDTKVDFFNMSAEEECAVLSEISLEKEELHQLVSEEILLQSEAELLLEIDRLISETSDEEKMQYSPMVRKG